MSQYTPSISHQGEPDRGSEETSKVVRPGDRVFAGLTTGSGVLVVVVIGLIAAFLLIRAVPSLADDSASFLTSRDWQVTGDVLRFGIAGLLWTTVVISLFAMLLALPVAIGLALFINFYAPRRLARPVAYVVDLLAAVPSIVFGLWGLYTFAPRIQPVADWIGSTFSWFPLLKETGVKQSTVFTGGIVLAIMILPIITAISRDVFAQVPSTHVEAALALGATRWEMIRTSVLPFGRPGVISASMLGLGRALGETIAITIILSTAPAGSAFSASLFGPGETFASKIANNASEFDTPKKAGAYIAAGLVLFLLTFAVNAAARVVINRSKEGAS